MRVLLSLALTMAHEILWMAFPYSKGARVISDTSCSDVSDHHPSSLKDGWMNVMERREMEGGVGHSTAIKWITLNELRNNGNGRR